MKKWLHKMINKKYAPHILAFLIPFLASIGILIGNLVYPLGEECMLHIDMYHQYLPFFTEFLDKLKSQDSLLYTWNLGLGSDYVSLYVYYLASPFNWLLVFCPRTHVIEFMELTIVLKMAIAGLGFFLFAKKLYPIRGKDGKVYETMLFPVLVCSTTYALCGFVAAYNWDIMWMDCIALFPFIMLGLYKLVREEKVALYYISLALSIWANYYISMMICMTLCVYFLYLFVKEKKHRGKSFLRFAWYSLLAGGTSAVLLLPEYYVLGYSGSQGINFPKTVEWYFGLIQELSRMNSFAEVYTGSKFWPNLYSGTFTILLVVLYFFNRRISWKEKVPRGILLAFFFASFSNNVLDFIWHGFHFPDSLPGRQSFIFSFFVLFMALAVLRKWRGNKLWHILVAALLVLAELIAGSFLMDEDVTDWFSFVLTGLFIGVYAIMLALIHLADKPGKRFYRNVVFVIALAEVIANMAATGFSVTSRTSYMEKYEDYENLIEQAEEMEEKNSFYRVEDLERKTKNDDSFYGYPSGTQFSSLMNINVSHFYQHVGMEGGKNFYCYNGATPLLTSMLSVKYLLTDDEICEGPLWHKVGYSGKQSLYEYQYPLNLGFMLPTSAMGWVGKSSDDIKNVNELAQSFGVSGELLEETDALIDAQSGSTTVTVSMPGYYYAVYTGCKSDTLYLYKNGEKRNYNKASHKYFLDLGYCQSDELVYVTNNNSETLSLKVYRLDMDVFADAYEILARDQMEILEKKSDYISGNIDVTSDGYLFLSVASEPGWTLYVDGVEREYESFHDTFITTYLEKGQHVITLSYMSPGFETGLKITSTCLILFLFTLLAKSIVGKRKKDKNGK